METYLNGTSNGNGRVPASRILGPDGQPFRADAPDSGFAIGHPIQFGSMISSGFRSYLHGQYDEAIRHSREDALAMRNDAFLMSLLQERKLAVASLQYRIDVDDERDPLQKAVQDGLMRIVRRIPKFRRMVMYLLEAIWYGRYASQMKWGWDKVKVPSLKDPKKDEERRCLVLKKHEPVNGDKIGHHWDGTPYLMINAAYSSSIKNAEMKPTTAGGMGLFLRGSWRWRYCVHTHEAVDADYWDSSAADAIHGVGIRSVLYWLDWLRKEWLSNVADWCERTGLGVRLWYFQGGNPKSKEAVEKAARESNDRTNILIPRYPNGGNSPEGVDFVDTSSTGADLLLRLQEHIEEIQERYVIGQGLSGGSQGGDSLGGEGKSRLAKDTKDQIRNYDAGNLGETLTTDVLRLIQWWTFKEPEARAVNARFAFNIDEPEPEKLLNAVKTFVLDLGGKVRASEVQAVIGMSAPQEGDEVISIESIEKQKQAAQPQQPGGMPGMPPGAEGGMPGMPAPGGAPGGAPGMPPGAEQGGQMPPEAAGSPGATPGQQEPQPQEPPEKAPGADDVRPKEQESDVPVEEVAAGLEDLQAKGEGTIGAIGDRHYQYLGRWAMLGSPVRYGWENEPRNADGKWTSGGGNPGKEKDKSSKRWKSQGAGSYQSEDKIEGEKIAFRANQIQGKWTVSFGREVPGVKGMCATVAPTDSHKKTMAIFRHVASKLRDFIEDEQPEQFHFTASMKEPSRVKLYDYLSKKITGEVPYKLDRNDDGNAITYSFQKDNATSFVGKPVRLERSYEELIRPRCERVEPYRFAKRNIVADNHFQELAEYYADLWNSGMEPDDEEIGEVAAELAESDWTVVENNDGEWEAVQEDEEGVTRFGRDGTPYRYEWVQFTGKRGGKGWRNSDNPKDVRYQESKPGGESAKKKVVKSETKKPKAATSVRKKADDTPSTNAVSLSAADKASAKRSLMSLRRHHGDKVGARLDAIAAQLKAALQRVPDEDGKAELNRQLQKVEWQKAEVGGKVEAEVIDAKKSFQGMKDAADELQAIRNDLARGNANNADLEVRCDAVGQWVAENGKNTGIAAKLLQEASLLRDKIGGGSGKTGTRIEPVASDDKLPDDFFDVKAKASKASAAKLLPLLQPLSKVGTSIERDDNRNKWKVKVGDGRWLGKEFSDPIDAVNASWEYEQDGDYWRKTGAVPDEVKDEIKSLKSSFTPVTSDEVSQSEHTRLVQQAAGVLSRSADELMHYSSAQLRKMMENAKDAAIIKPDSADLKSGAQDELASGSKGGDSGRLPTGEQLGADAPASSEPVLPGSGKGTGEGSGGVHPGSGEPVPGSIDRPDSIGAGSAGSEGSVPSGTAADPTGRGADGRTVGTGGSGTGRSRVRPKIADESADEESVAEPATAENPTDARGDNFRYTSDDFAKGGLKAKFKANIEAIKTLKTIQLEGRTTATPEEQVILSRFVGWGQFPQLFGYKYDREWDKEKKILAEVLSSDELAIAAESGAEDEVTDAKEGEEYKSARSSTKNAHYTHPDIVKAHWAMAKRLGFKGGKFLETSAGVGYYLGLIPPELAGKTKMSAVELDKLTGQILKMLYPKANVNVMGFQDYPAPDNFYDLVASNVPFGNYTVHDPKYNKHLAKVHDYFFLKSADVTRPGGLVMHITSTGTMDKPRNASIRDELAKTCDFVAAIRFPGQAHKENAGTDVVTDMVILRKRHPGEKPVDETETPTEAEPKQPGFTGITTDSLGRTYHWVDGKRVPGPNWLDTAMVPDPAGGDPIPVNKYFADHPEQILGTLDRTGTMRSGKEKNVSKTDDYEERLAAAIERLPEGLLKPAAISKEAFVPDRMPAPGDVRVGGYTIQDGKVYRREGGALVEQQYSAKDKKRLEAMLGVRDAQRAVINAQLRGEDATDARKELNAAYDAFVEKHGFLNDKENAKVFHDDPDSFGLLALEKYDKKGKTSKKADIFVKDTVRSNVAAESASNTHEALGISLHETGGVDVERMAQLTGKKIREVEKDLIESGTAFLDPSLGWKPADQYLSGNVRQKLVLARAAAAADPKFKVNVDALEKVQPEDLTADQIKVKMGAPWVPSSDVKDFVAHILNGSPDGIRADYLPNTGQWMADFDGSAGAWMKRSNQAKVDWATEEVPFKKILEAALNNTPVVVYYPKIEKDEKPVVNTQATNDAKAKIKDMRERFSEWLWEDESRKERLLRFYNDNFNNIRPIKYDGQFQTFPGINPNMDVRPHIKDFVWQVVTTGKGLAAHEVGLGKCQPLDAKILTPGGWSLMGDIRIGDDVIAGDGTRTKVIGVFPQGEKEIYRVMMSDGSSTECCDEHLWLTQTYHERNYAIAARHAKKTHWDCDKPKVRTLAEIMKTLVDPRLGGVKNHSIPIVGQVEFYASPVPFSPYLLGVIIGDGSIASKSSVCISNARKDVEIIDYVRAELSDDLKIKEQVCSAKRVLVSADGEERNGCPAWTIQSKKYVGFGKDRKPSSVLKALRELGLMGRRSHDKFIPDVFKFNEASVRIAVLQGLLDTDGYISSKAKTVIYYTVSDQLADDVVFLVQSLGGTVSRSIKKPTYVYKGEKKQGKPCHVLCLCLPPDIMPFRLKRKADLVVAKTKYKPTRYIVGVEYVGKKPSQCISVAHESQLYVTDDFIVTHNTRTMVISAMELRRLGLAKKPCIVCMKANVESIADEALQLYPGAKILTTADVFDAKSRKKTIAQIATGDYDMVIMTHDNLNMLQMKHETVKGFIEEEIAELEAAKLAAYKEDPSKDNRIVKALETAKENLEAKLRDALDESKKDDATYFEDTGIDQLFVDEAHLFKSLPCYTKQQNLKGIPTTRSDRATAMLMRARWLMAQHNGRGLVFATGTPITNTMAEMYNMQRYLQPQDLHERGIEAFDAWANVFGETETNMEFTPSGEYKPITRFASFTNLGELQAMSRQMMDVQRAEDLKKEDGSPVVVRPKRKEVDVLAPKTEAVERMMASLVDRAKNLDPRDRKKDNMLSIATDGRKGSLDMRLLDASAKDDPNSKVNKCVANVLDIAKKRPGVTQMIFSDLGVNPTKSKASLSADAIKDWSDLSDVAPGIGGFHLYKDIIDKLVAGGIPRDQIADFTKLEGVKKEEAQEAMRQGKIRVAIGSTQKMGTGVNVQDKLAAMHTLDVPYLPSAVEQRDGRGWRSGNINDPMKGAHEQEVGIYRYLTEGSLDQWNWEIIARKTKFIKQVISNKDVGARELKEEDSESITPERLAAIASGDVRYMEKVNVDEDVKNLKMAEKRHNREQQRLKDTVHKMEHSEFEGVPGWKKLATDYQGAVEHLEKHPLEEGEFKITIGGQEYADRKEAKEAFDKLDEEARENYHDTKLGTFRGFDLYRTRGGVGSTHYLKAPSGFRIGIGMSGPASAEYATRNMAKKAQEANEQLEKAQKSLEMTRANLGKPFAKAEELKTKMERSKQLEQELAKKDKKDGDIDENDPIRIDPLGAVRQELEREEPAIPKNLRPTPPMPAKPDEIKGFGKELPEDIVEFAIDKKSGKSAARGFAVGPLAVVATGTSRKPEFTVYHQATGLRAFVTDDRDVAKAAAHIMQAKGGWDFKDVKDMDDETQKHGGAVSRAVRDGNLTALAQLAQTAAKTDEKELDLSGDTPAKPAPHAKLKAMHAEPVSSWTYEGIDNAIEPLRDLSGKELHDAAKDILGDSHGNAVIAVSNTKDAIIEKLRTVFKERLGSHLRTKDIGKDPPSYSPIADEYKESVMDLPAVEPAPKPREYKIKTVDVSGKGKRFVHGFIPDESFWTVYKKNKPPYASVYKDKNTGRWQASVWGENEKEVMDNIEDMRKRGVKYERSYAELIRYKRERVIKLAYEKHKFASTQFNLTGEAAEQVLELADTIRDADLAEDGREDQPHVTILFGLHGSDPKKVQDLVRGFGPVTVRLGEVSIFAAHENESQRGGAEFDVVKVEVHGEKLHRLHKLLMDLEHTSTHLVYSPHATLAYVKPGDGQKYVGKRDVEGVECHFTEFVFADQDGAETVISLLPGGPKRYAYNPSEPRDKDGKWTDGGSRMEKDKTSSWRESSIDWDVEYDPSSPMGILDIAPDIANVADNWQGEMKTEHVVDSDGFPKVFFHGSQADSIDGDFAFDLGKHDFGHGVYLTTDPGYAILYSHNKPGGVEEASLESMRENGIIPSVARIKNPFVPEKATMQGIDEIMEFIGESPLSEYYNRPSQAMEDFVTAVRKNTAGFTKWLKSKGYDSVYTTRHESGGGSEGSGQAVLVVLSGANAKPIENFRKKT